jgi:hypothetical protein
MSRKEFEKELSKLQVELSFLVPEIIALNESLPPEVDFSHHLDLNDGRIGLR